MSRYETDIDLGNPNTSHTQVVELVGFGKVVLDVGCATGDLARALNGRSCRVSGFEIDGEAAEKARPDLERLVIGDLNDAPLSAQFKPGEFDVIVFADVLEHLGDPRATLRDALSLLGPEGRVIVSIPNVTHGSLRLALLQGRWRYTETGLLDHTHVRFFDRAGLLRLFEESGLVVEELRSTVADPLRVEVAVDAESIPAEVVEWVRDQPDALNYQFVASARPQVEGEESPPAPELAPAVADDAVRLQDEHWQSVRDDAEDERRRAAEELDLRHRVMTTRDAVVGLEASVASALIRVRRAERRAVRAETRVDNLTKRSRRASTRAKRAEKKAERLAVRLRRVRRAANDARQELDAARRSRSWRLGRAVTKPFRVFTR
ncbi:MAG: class I SAM-dependent methyltransferase [Nocardioides sp.]